MGGNQCYVPLSGGETVRMSITDTLGANWAFAVPANYEYRFDAVLFRFITDATVINRFPVIAIIANSDGVVLFSNTLSPVPATNGRDVQLHIGASRQADVVSGSGAYVIGSLPPCRVRSGDFIGVSIQNIQAGDTLTLINLNATRWKV